MRIFLFSVLILISSSNALADQLAFSFLDPVGDHTGVVDVIRMDFTFDNATGDYTVVVTASVSNPFLGDIRVNLALFNPDIGAMTLNPSFLQDDANDFNLQSSLTTLMFTGTSARLQSWAEGNRVATSHGPFGVPSDATFFSFFTTMFEAPFGTGGVDRIADGEVATITPAPQITTLSPGSITAGSPGFDLTVVGENFETNSVVQWDGAERSTTFNSSQQLRAKILASDVVNAGSAFVTVSGPGISNKSEIQVGNPLPLIDCFDPTAAITGSSDFTITIYGSSFVPQSVVQWDGSPRQTTFESSRELKAEISASDIAESRTASITVLSPDPGGGLSPTMDFPISSIDPNAPRITRLDPDMADAGGPAFILTVHGTGFVPASMVQFNGQNRFTTFVNATQLRADIPDTDIALGCSATVTVENPSAEANAPNEVFETVSNPGVFTIVNPFPVLVEMTPTSQEEGRPSFFLTVEGVGFVSASKVRWNGSDRATTFVNETELASTMLMEDIAEGGTGSVSVANPGPGGGISVSRTFTIRDATPSATTLYYPRLVSTDGIATGTDNSQTTGIAVANLGDGAATLTMTALDKDGNQITGPDITNPASIAMPALEQLPIVESQVFGEGMRPRKPDGWLKVESTGAEVIGFFLSFNDSLTTLDGADVTSNTLTSFVLPEIEDEGFTEIHVANPGPGPASVSLEIRQADGTPRTAAVLRNVNANGTIAELFEDLFPGITPDGSDYLMGTSDRGVVAFEFLGKPSIYVEGLNGQDTAGGGTTLYSPQYVVGGPNWRTTLSVVNLDGQAGTVTFEFIGDGGMQIGMTRMLAIAANGKIQVTDQTFFLDAGDTLTQGYVKITSDGPRLTGGVVFGDPGRRIFSSALPLVSTLQDAVIFGQVASNETFFTGLALLNPNDMAVMARIEVFDRNGDLVISKVETIAAGRRLSLLLTQYFPELDGVDISSGYIKVTIDKGVASFALFGARDLSVLSAVPPQLVP